METQETKINRQYRRKSQKIISKAKPGITARDVEEVADDLTAARFQKSVSRKRLRKVGTVTLGEKVKEKPERRQEAVGRNVERRAQRDEVARKAVDTLVALDGEELRDVVTRVERLCHGDAQELKVVLGNL